MVWEDHRPPSEGGGGVGWFAEGSWDVEGVGREVRRGGEGGRERGVQEWVAGEWLGWVLWGCGCG